MNQQPGLLHPSLPCSGPCRPSNGQWQHGRGGSLPRWPTQDDSEEGKSWCHSGKKKIRKPETKKKQFDRLKMWWVRSGSPSPSCILEFILVWTVLDVPHLLWTISRMPCIIMLQVLETHIFLSPNLWLHQAPLTGVMVSAVPSLAKDQSKEANSKALKSCNTTSQFQRMKRMRKVNANSSLEDWFGVIVTSFWPRLMKLEYIWTLLIMGEVGWCQMDTCVMTLVPLNMTRLKEIWKDLRRKMTGGWQHSEMP